MKIIEPYVSVLNDQEDDMDMLFQLRRHNLDRIRKIKDTHFTVYEHVSYHQDAYDWILQNSVAYYNFSDQFNIEYRHHTYPGHLVHAILANHMNQLHQSVHVPFSNLDLLPILFDDEILNKGMFSPLRLSIIEDNEKGIAFSLRNQFKSFEPEVLRSIFKASQEYSQDKFGRTEFKYSGLLDRYIDQHRQFDASNEHLIKACVLSLLGIESLEKYQAYVDYSIYPLCGEDFVYHFPVLDSDRNHALSAPSAPVDFSTFIFDFTDSSDDEESVNVQSSQAMPMVRPEHVLIPYVLMLQKRAILEQISHHVSLNDPSYVNPFLCRIHTLTHQILKQEETLEDKPNTNAMLELVSDFPWLFSESEILNNKHIFDTYMKQLDTNYLNKTTVTKYIVYLMKKEHAIFLYDVEKQYLIARMLDCQPKHSLWDEFPGIQSGRNNFTTAMSNINHDISTDVLPKIVSYYGSSISFFTSEADVYAKEPVFDLLKIPEALRDDLIDLTRVMIKNCILNDFKQGYCALKTKYSITSEMNDMIIKYAEYYQRDDILKYLQKSKDSEKDCATSQSYDHYLEHASNKRLRG
ncbi:MAG: hypothetical protein P8L77_03075 [Gammaproteobacteria bacterium]|nr:hypothetical protein [Gammaproteobacteria bacterium]